MSSSPFSVLSSLIAGGAVVGGAIYSFLRLYSQRDVEIRVGGKLVSLNNFVEVWVQNGCKDVIELVLNPKEEKIDAQETKEIVGSVVTLSGFNLKIPSKIVHDRLVAMAGAGLLFINNSDQKESKSKGTSFQVVLDGFFKFIITLIKWGHLGLAGTSQNTIQTVCDALKAEFKKEEQEKRETFKSVQILVSDGDSLRVVMCSLNMNVHAKQVSAPVVSGESKEDQVDWYVVSYDIFAKKWNKKWRSSLITLVQQALRTLSNSENWNDVEADVERLRKNVFVLIDGETNRQSSSPSSVGPVNSGS